MITECSSELESHIRYILKEITKKVRIHMYIFAHNILLYNTYSLNKETFYIYHMYDNILEEEFHVCIVFPNNNIYNTPKARTFMLSRRYHRYVYSIFCVNPRKSVAFAILLFPSPPKRNRGI